MRAFGGLYLATVHKGFMSACTGFYEGPTQLLPLFKGCHVRCQSKTYEEKGLLTRCLH